ncbi:hypothetical protein T492DRAFT_1046912 [Pavlovales sp. CCMP2436]|nr:hypothetical protein T492DRAFT_1046912 [Pavlovales sp. CCMP2436]
MAYTFKDSSIDKTYYKDYNKVDGQQAVLVGNWAEERALKESTGQMRSTQWVEPSSAMLQGVAEPSHTKMKGHPDMEDTTMRVFFHSDAHRDSLFLVESGLLAPHLADYGAAASHFDVSNLPVEPVTYADSMYVTGQTKGEASGSYPRARNDYFSKPIELSKKPGVFLDD